MKKFLYLCGMMLISLNMMAQIDPYDRNWDTIVYDDFSTPGRFWHYWSFRSNDGVWRAYPGTGVTHGDDELMVYQYNQCHFNDNDQVMELVADYDTANLIPSHSYSLPSWMKPEHGGPGFPVNDSLFFFSGEIDYYNEQMTDSGRFKYGYFEIRCKLPIHTGAFPAFWLWYADSISPSNRYYEEIDIFEFSWSFENFPNDHNNPHPHGSGNPHCFTTGIHYSDTTNHLHWKHSKARNFPMIEDSLNHWHTFACEWLPEHVIWYCDGNIVNECHNPDYIPRHALTLKTNYAIDKYALMNHNYGEPLIWEGSDKMVIDHIKVCQLDWQCDTDEIITRQSELNYFDYAVKKSINITSTIESVSVGNTKKVTFRATDSFEITGPFQVNCGGEMTAIMQSCPE